MNPFDIKLKLEDSRLTAALLDTLMSIEAKQDAINILLLEEIARRSKQDSDTLTETYAQMVADLKLTKLADLEDRYSESKQLEMAAQPEP